jgi:sterol desaturase/sphingolipid hydroxylase (fatty acid hydroxylase superfamily)
MDEARFQLIKTAGFAASFAVVLAVQTLVPYRRAPRAVSGNWRQNVPLAVLNTILMSLVCGACLCTASRYAADRGLGLFRTLAVPAWPAAAGTVVALDFVLWGWHLANHRLRWLWRFHRVHHSDVDFDISTSLRFHAGELLLSLPLKLAAIVALGASVMGVLLFEVLFGLFNMFVHGNVRMSPRWEARLTPVFILPAVHRLHHSIRPDEHGRNFGTVLSLWDRLLGTWADGRSTDRVTTGLPDLAGRDRLSLWQCLALPFARRAFGTLRR